MKLTINTETNKIIRTGDQTPEHNGLLIKMLCQCLADLVYEQESACAYDNRLLELVIDVIEADVNAHAKEEWI